MRVSSIATAALLHASAAWSSPLENAKVPTTRPIIAIAPFHPGKAFAPSPPRNRTCTVKSSGAGKDDSANILSAIKSCNNGGHVVFSSGTTYTIGTALDLTFLEHIDLDIRGTLLFTNDTTYWQRAAFPQVFQNATTFFQLGGRDVNVFGGGALDGNGQAWYDLYAKDKFTLRPILFGTIGLHGGSIADLNLRYSPQWYNLVANSTDVVFSNITIAGKSKSGNEAKNTDGWDTYRSSNIVIQNSVIDNGDDCVSFKPNSTAIVVQNLACTGSHGISVGSLGQYPGTVDIVRDVFVHNITMTSASSGARIKVWPGISSTLSPDLQGGGGSGSVSNISYSAWRVRDVDYAVEITQCYGQKNLTLCNEFPANLTISDVRVSDFTGTTSKKYDPLVGSLVCSSPKVCSGIALADMRVTSPSGKSVYACANVGAVDGMVECRKAV